MFRTIASLRGRRDQNANAMHDSPPQGKINVPDVPEDPTAGNAASSAKVELRNDPSKSSVKFQLCICAIMSDNAPATSLQQVRQQVVTQTADCIKNRVLQRTGPE
jgi:hypothetical protein